MYARFGKRSLDIVAASTAVIILFIPGLLVALWIKLDSKGPVIFKQLRYGRNQKPFTVYKFRTMSTEAPSDIATNSFNDAKSYITRSGKIMRKLSIDELPQIFNVLGGSMSIVGPRPVVLSETKLIYLRERHDANSVKPGITGWAQVNGRDELNDTVKSQMDGEYVRNFGIRTDTRVLMKTLLVILTAAGHTEEHSHDEIESLDTNGLKRAE